MSSKGICYVTSLHPAAIVLTHQMFLPVKCWLHRIGVENRTYIHIMILNCNKIKSYALAMLNLIIRMVPNFKWLVYMFGNVYDKTAQFQVAIGFVLRNRLSELVYGTKTTSIVKIKWSGNQTKYLLCCAHTVS